jgi:hypothetical protein
MCSEAKTPIVMYTIFSCVYVRTSVCACVHVRMYVCMYVCMYICTINEMVIVLIRQ